MQRRFSNKPTAHGKFADFFEKIESYVDDRCRASDGAAWCEPLYVSLHREDIVLSLQIPRHPYEPGRDHRSLGQVGGRRCGDHWARRHRRVHSGLSCEDAGARNPSVRFRSLPCTQRISFAGETRRERDGKAEGRSLSGALRELSPRIEVRAQFIDSSSRADLDGVTFAFVCVDKGSARSAYSIS